MSLYNICAILRELTTGHKLQRPAYAAFRHFEQLLDTIEEDYAQQLTLERLADVAGLPKAYFTTKLRQMTGRTALQWVLDRRMKEARRLLFETDFFITHIALDLGDTVQELATLDDGARCFWTAPGYADERIQSIGELASPELSRDVPRLIQRPKSRCNDRDRFDNRHQRLRA